MKKRIGFLSGCVCLMASTNGISAENAASPASGPSAKANAVSSRAATRVSGIRVYSSLACAQNEGDGTVIAFAPAGFSFENGPRTRQAIDSLWKRIDKPDCQSMTAVLTASTTDMSKCSNRDFVLLMNAEAIECLQAQNVPYAFRNLARAGHTTSFDQQGRLVHGPGWIVNTYHNTALEAKVRSKPQPPGIEMR